MRSPRPSESSDANPSPRSDTGRRRGVGARHVRHGSCRPPLGCQPAKQGSSAIEPRHPSNRISIFYKFSLPESGSAEGGTPIAASGSETHYTAQIRAKRRTP
ncbi:hypothetical protein PT2222_110207 [Paraburkholderia tropica]